MTKPGRYFAIAIVLVLLAPSTLCLAQTPAVIPGAPSNTVIPSTPSTEKAISTATAFMNAVIRDSSIDNLLLLCGLPFCHDDSVILITHAELRNALTQLIAAAAKDRGRTHPRVDTAYVLDIRKEALFGMVPINIYFTVVNLKFSYEGKEASRLLILAVQLTDEARVVGIED
jgi:hypothetical protein